MKYCTYCGSCLPDDARFCNYCGKETVDFARESAQQPTATVVSAVKEEPDADAMLNTNPFEQYANEKEAPVAPVAPVAEAVYEAPAAPVAPVAEVTYEASAAYNSKQQQSEEESCLKSISSKLKAEVICYKVYGIITLVTSILSALLSPLFFYVSSLDAREFADIEIKSYYTIGGQRYDNLFNDPEAIKILFMVFGIVFASFFAAFLIIAIINLVMGSRVAKYKNMAYTDCAPAFKHASGVKTIVLNVFINEIALIFVIINFVQVRKNRAVFDRIKQKQSDYNNKIN